MNVRWRLLILCAQVLALSVATYLVTGKPYAPETWYAAGILAVVINPQLLEPYYPRPADVPHRGPMRGKLQRLYPDRPGAPGCSHGGRGISPGGTSDRQDRPLSDRPVPR